MINKNLSSNKICKYAQNPEGSLKRTNQDYYRGKGPETVLEYIDLQPSESHAHLKGVMTAI